MYIVISYPIICYISYIIYISYNHHILQKHTNTLHNCFSFLQMIKFILVNQTRKDHKTCYGFVIKPLFVNRMLGTHGGNILKVCNFITKIEQLKFQFRFKKRKCFNFFPECWRNLFQIKGLLHEILNLVLISLVLNCIIYLELYL